MKVEENAEYLINARTKLVYSLRINERAGHANKTCYPVEYLTSIPLFMDEKWENT